MHPRPVVLLAVTLIPLSCRSPGESRGPSEPSSEVADFTLVLLRAGDLAPTALGEAELSAAYAGHRRFIEEQSEAGTLLLTGPFTAAEGADELRGLFVFRGADLDAVQALLAEDPPTHIGLFEPSFVALTTLSSLGALPERMQARSAARGEAGEDPARPDLRSYTLVIAPDGLAAMEALGGSLLAQHVVLLGRLGHPAEDALLAILDLAEPRQVEARLAVTETSAEGWLIRRWLSTPALGELMQGAR